MKMINKAISSLATLIAIFSFMKLAIAADYRVGVPEGGWDEATDLATWASRQTFLTGDNLIFSYTQNHDVIEVSEDDFGPCTTNNPLQGSPYTGGSTTIPLTSAGTRYFICGTAGHCLTGMKLQITTLAAASAPPPATTPSPPTTTPSAPSTPPTPSARPPVSSSPPKSMAPKVSPSAPPPRVSTGNPTLPRASAPPPGDSLTQTPPPAPSSAGKFNVMGALLIACSSFVMIIFLNL